ncbi:alpha/beta hydrolase family protein [Singulisphaera sp. PoT]|uniref:alpha/beta hydrolase family protein n=1 Tax=Singulisphaera sp. PoT TaxID=3411797 RepID=UPI003BF57A65
MRCIVAASNRSVLLLLLAFASMARANDAPGPEPTDVAFTSKLDGSEQRYVLIGPPSPSEDRPRDLLIALHGHGSDRWQFARDARDECRATRDFAARHGMIFVSPDYRARTSWMGPKAEADLVQIIETLKSQHKIDRVFLCGGSMGGSSTLTFAALHPDLLHGIASMNGTANHLEYDQFQDAIAESFGGPKRSIPGEYKKRSAEYWPERLTMPVALTVGGQDTVVPPASVRRLAAILKTLDRPILLLDRPAGGHSTTYDDALAILEFMFKNAK